MSKILLMPTAKLVSSELRTEFGPIPSAMIPLNSQPAVRYIANPYLARGYELVMGVNERADLVRDYTRRHPALGASLIDVGNTTSLGATILAVLDGLKTKPHALVINFADTFVGDDLAGEDVVCYREADEVYRWTTFQIADDRKITRLADKVPDNPFGSTQPVFVGVFAISDSASFQDYLREAVGTQHRDNTDPFYIALVQYFNALPTERKHLQAVTDWRDFGHLDTYYQTKRAFCINRRFFNNVEIDERRGIVRKSSTDVRKLLNEMKWYTELPNALRYIAPRVFDYSFTRTEPFMELEYYSYPALNDVYLYGNLDLSIWKRVLGAIANVVSQMHSHRFQPADSGQLTRAMRTMYEEKTNARLKPILEDDRFARFFPDCVEINGTACMGIHRCLEALPRVAEALELYSLGYFTVIHGDLCLSNILYDRRNSFIRLIDPRGEFGEAGIFGDMRYDLAKLCHSLEGDYDFIVNGLFDAEWTERDFQYEPQLDPRHREIKKLFHNWFTGNFGQYYTQVKLIESFLFLSMVPLHADSFASQQVFLAHGLRTFSEIAKSILPNSIGVPA